MRLSFLGVRGPDTLGAWVSDGLMCLFFLVVILELKTEIVGGHLASPRRIALPLAGAVGGMMVPALIYLLVTHGAAQAVRGWAIPVATDAAFTLPVIMALGRRVSAGARAWLMALAIFDDVLGIVVIALFYGAAPCWPAVGAAAMVMAGLIGMNRAGVGRVWPYAVGGVVLWGMLVESGLHPTLAGVVTGLCLPATAGCVGRPAPLGRVAAALGPLVAWGVLPVFGFLNVGVSLAGMRMGTMLAPVPMGIMLGLLVGKPVGVFGMTVLCARLKIATLPANTPMAMMFGLSLLCGIGFTISLFIAALAFGGTDMVAVARMGIFMGSVLSALAGWGWLRLMPVRSAR